MKLIIKIACPIILLIMVSAVFIKINYNYIYYSINRELAFREIESRAMIMGNGCYIHHTTPYQRIISKGDAMIPFIEADLRGWREDPTHARKHEHCTLWALVDIRSIDDKTIDRYRNYVDDHKHIYAIFSIDYEHLVDYLLNIEDT